MFIFFLSSLKNVSLYTIYLLTGVINPQLIETAQSEYFNCESIVIIILHIFSPKCTSVYSFDAPVFCHLNTCAYIHI